jgi:amino acid permease
MSYKTAATVLLGPTIAAIVDWSVILTLLGTCIAYVNIIGALLPPIFELAAKSPDSVLCGSSGILLWQALISFFLFFPLSLIRNLDGLSATSLVSSHAPRPLRATIDPDLYSY